MRAVWQQDRFSPIVVNGVPGESESTRQLAALHVLPPLALIDADRLPLVSQPGIERIHSGAVTSELVQQAVCDFQIGCLKALGEPAVDPRKQLAAFFASALVAPHARETGGGA